MQMKIKQCECGKIISRNKDKCKTCNEMVVIE